MKIKRVKYTDSNLIEEQTEVIAEPVDIEACGFLVKETDSMITLARECIGDEFRGQISIPKSTIIKVYELQQSN